MKKKERSMQRILIIDDDRLFLDAMRQNIHEEYPALEVITHEDPIQGIKDINASIDLLLLDLEMPGMDGTKLLAYATASGIDKSRIIIISGRDADHLHQIFPMGVCLAVLNKHEARQKNVLRMVLNSMQAKCG
jgi:DNA-binding NarL/FixJ family response regulator